MKHEYKLKVRWGDTDAAGIVFSPNYYKWMDEATQEFFSTMGFPMSELFSTKKNGIPLLESHCKFKTPLFFEDEICVTTTMKVVKSKVFRTDHTFTRGDQLIAEGYEIRAWASFVNAVKAIEIPEEVKQKMM